LDSDAWAFLCSILRALLRYQNREADFFYATLENTSSRTLDSKFEFKDMDLQQAVRVTSGVKRTVGPNPLFAMLQCNRQKGKMEKQNIVIQKKRAMSSKA